MIKVDGMMIGQTIYDNLLKHFVFGGIELLFIIIDF